MDTLETLKRRMETARTLGDLVRTMKTLAAVSVRHYEALVATLAEYDHTIDLGMRALLRHAAAPPPSRPRPELGRMGVLVFGSDQGLCGAFNEHVVRRALEDLEVTPPNRFRLHAIGTRAGARLAEAGLELEGQTSLPLSASLLPAVVQDLLLVIDGWREEGDLEGVVLYYNRLLDGTSTRPHRYMLLPIPPELLRRLSHEPWPTPMLPLHTVDRQQLLSVFTRQYLFVKLHSALALSLAAEHASRLLAMQAAERNIDERLDELRGRYHSQRQTAITTELLDIVSGFEALSSSGS